MLKDKNRISIFFFSLSSIISLLAVLDFPLLFSVPFIFAVPPVALHTSVPFPFPFPFLCSPLDINQNLSLHLFLLPLCQNSQELHQMRNCFIVASNSCCACMCVLSFCSRINGMHTHFYTTQLHIQAHNKHFPPITAVTHAHS